MVLLNNSLLALCILCPITAFAHDLIQPVWRGQQQTTFQHWRFDTNENPAEPEIIINPYGQAEAAITVGDFGEGWAHDLNLGLTGLWNIGGLGGSLILDIPGQSSLMEYEDILVQVTYYVGLAEAPTIHVTDAAFLNEVTILVLDDPPLGRWNLKQSQWRIYPAPEHKQIILISDPTWGSVIDQVVVDTKAGKPDCIVDVNDLAEFCEQWLYYGPDLKFDLNNSEHVDFKDFALFANSWLDLCQW